MPGGAMYYCPSCSCYVGYSNVNIAAINGCYTLGDGLTTGIGKGNSNGENDPNKSGGNPNAAAGVTSSLPFGFNLPFGLGLNSFLNDFMKMLCEKILPDGLCKIAKTIVTVLLILLLVIAFVFIKQFISRR